MTEVYATPEAACAQQAPAAYASGSRPILSVRQIEKVYGNKDSVTKAVRDISFDVMPGEFVGIMGPSGSGKTTLLNCVATIDTVTSGHILVDGRDVTGLRSRALAKFRRDDLGFIFQDSNLLDTLTGFENIALALTVKGEPAGRVKPKVDAIAATLGVSEVLGKYPYQMSVSYTHLGPAGGHRGVLRGAALGPACRARRGGRALGVRPAAAAARCV